MTISAQGRLLRINQTVVDQVDYMQVDAFTRVAGLTVANVDSKLFFDNAVEPWTLANGASIGDGQVKSGYVYFHEITDAPGHYSLRFRPNAAGYWRLLLTYTAGQQIVVRNYDVIMDPLPMQGGLKASFV